jgi:phosphopantetheinyl transferase (holo-ACP synthase)
MLVTRWAAKEAHAKALGIASRLEGSDIHTWQDGGMLHARSAGARPSSGCVVRMDWSAPSP